MKLPANALLASAILMASGGAVAATSVNLQVTGKILASACEIDPVGRADFGTIDRHDLSATQTKQIGSRLVNLTVKCTANSLISIRVVDNKTHKLNVRTGFKFEHGSYIPEFTLNPDAFFSLGAADADKPIGAAAIRVGAISVDGNARNWTVQAPSPAQLKSVLPSAFPFVTPGSYIAPSISESASTNVIGKVFIFPLDVAVAIDRLDNLPSATDVDLGGSVTISVHYI